MVTLEMIAHAALAQDNLSLRSAVQGFLREHPALSGVERPAMLDLQGLSVVAALLELLAGRLGQQPPAWTSEVGPAPTPIFLVKSALTMRRLRDLCEAQAPEPLKKRRLYAPPDFLSFA